MTTLLVASSGGHITELLDLLPRLEGIDDVAWVTFDTPQTRSVLAGANVTYVRHTQTRDVPAIVANLLPALRMLRSSDIDAVVSTGAGIALSFLPLARTLGHPAHYIELITRIDGPSATGRVLEAVPGVRLYTQHAGWTGRRWRYEGSVLDGYSLEPLPEPPRIGSVVVTVGTQRRYGFRRLIERLAALLPPEADVLWQTGATDVAGLGLDTRREVPSGELAAAMASADLVVGHAGTGTVVGCLQAGRCPLVVPRSAQHGEHIDDHQAQFARELTARGIAVARSVEDLDEEALLLAAAQRVRRTLQLPPFVLR